MGAALVVCALHFIVFALVLLAHEPRTVAAPVHVVVAQLITSAATASAIPAPAAVPQRAPPRAHERPTNVPHPAAHAAATPVRERAAEPPRQEAPAAAPQLTQSPLSSARQPDAAPSAAAQQADADDTPRGSPSAATPRAVAQLDCAIAKPVYPVLSRRRQESGTVLVELRVDVTGRVDAAHVVASSGYARLDAAALDAVQSGACMPYRERGRPVPATAKVPVVFNLSD